MARIARDMLLAEEELQRVLVRLTPGVEAVTHRSIQTAHEESKFGLSPDAAERQEILRRSLDIDLDPASISIPRAIEFPTGDGADPLPASGRRERRRVLVGADGIEPPTFAL